MFQAARPLSCGLQDALGDGTVALAERPANVSHKLWVAQAHRRRLLAEESTCPALALLLPAPFFAASVVPVTRLCCTRIEQFRSCPEGMSVSPCSSLSVRFGKRISAAQIASVSSPQCCRTTCSAVACSPFGSPAAPSPGPRCLRILSPCLEGVTIGGAGPEGNRRTRGRRGLQVADGLWEPRWEGLPLTPEKQVMVDGSSPGCSLWGTAQPAWGRPSRHTFRPRTPTWRRRTRKYKMLAGTSVPGLAKKVADILEVELMSVTCGRFSDGEVELLLGEVLAMSMCLSCSRHAPGQ